MDSFKVHSKEDVLTLVNLRDGEEKLGEQVLVYDSEIKAETEVEVLKNSEAKFVLLGIPEDIGIKANLGIAGVKSAWEFALKALLNIQSNPFLMGNEILV